MNMKKISLVLLALTIALSGFSQERKKVAVVLSGGGAKGMAHIGALKVIEKAKPCCSLKPGQAESLLSTSGM